MERTEAEIISTPLFQFYKASNNVDYINAAKDLLYAILRDHGAANFGIKSIMGDVMQA
jgi:hypothetical protein